MGHHAILSGKNCRTTQKNVCVEGSVTRNMEYRKIPKISPSKYKPPKPVTQKTLR